MAAPPAFEVGEGNIASPGGWIGIVLDTYPDSWDWVSCEWEDRARWRIFWDLQLDYWRDRAQKGLGVHIGERQILVKGRGLLQSKGGCRNLGMVRRGEKDRRLHRPLPTGRNS